MLCVPYIHVFMLLVLCHPVLSKFVKMTAANEPEKLKGKLKFEQGRGVVNEYALFDAEQSDGYFGFKFGEKCDNDVIFKMGSYHFTVPKEYIAKVPSNDRTVTVSKTGEFGGGVTGVTAYGGKLELNDGRVLMSITVVNNPACEVEMITGYPVVDDAGLNLIGGYTREQIVMMALLPVVAVGLLVLSIFLTYKLVKYCDKKKETLKKKKDKKAVSEKKKTKKQVEEVSQPKSDSQKQSKKESPVIPCMSPVASLEGKKLDEKVAKLKLQLEELTAEEQVKTKEKEVAKTADAAESELAGIKLAAELEKARARLVAALKMKEDFLKRQKKRASKKKNEARKAKTEVATAIEKQSEVVLPSVEPKLRPVPTANLDLKTAEEKVVVQKKGEAKKVKEATLRAAEENCQVKKVKVKTATMKTAKEKVEKIKRKSRTTTVSCGKEDDMKVLDEDWRTAKNKALSAKKTTRSSSQGKEDDMAVLDEDNDADKGKKAAAARKKTKKSETKTEASCCVPEDDMAVLDEDWQTAKKRRASRNTTNDPSQEPNVTVMGRTLSASVPEDSEDRRRWQKEREKALAYRASQDSQEPLIARRVKPEKK